MRKRALITGITGQDGSYLAELLLSKNYEVYGVVRRSSSFNTGRIANIYQDPHVPDYRLKLMYGDLNDASSLNRILREVRPDEIYNLGAQSHVRVSFDVPEYTAEVTGLGTVRLLEAIRESGISPRFYQASSSELFGSSPPPQSETTPFHPRSPYGAAKIYSYWITVNYRESYQMHASNGILFNHESPRRGETFVTRKITRAAARIKLGLQDKLFLGNLDAKRDWGFAGDYVQAMWLMLQQDKPDDYVIATGECHTVREFLDHAFGRLSVDWKKHVEIDPRYYRPAEVDELRGDMGKAKRVLKWEPKVKFEELVHMMVDADLADLRTPRRACGGATGTMSESQPVTFSEREAASKRRRIDAQERFAASRDEWRRKNSAYYEAIERLVKFVVPEGASVLEIGCGTGDLLVALKPAHGVGIDMSPGMIDQARARHSKLEFHVGDAETLDAPELKGRTFDFIVLADVVGLIPNVWAALRALRAFCTPRTRVIVTYYNFLWEPLLKLGERIGRKMPIEQQNWLGMQDIENLLYLNHFDIVRSGTAQLLPLHVPVLAPALNRYLAQLPVLRHLALTQFFVCRPADGGGPIAARDYTCSVIVPCKNELGNVDDIIARTPDMGRGTELIFVDGNSTDGTVAAIEAHLARGTRKNMRLIHQGDGKGKGDAVRKGFAAAKGDVLFILDADLTVPPEDLPMFYAAISEGRGEFINGSRLVYPMEGEAMRLLNSFGNKLFGLSISAILEQRLKDTLCGTKVLFRRDYERIADARGFFGNFDPFGDFDLIFGAAKQNLKIVELPIRYRARTYGETKISRFRHGAQLAKMTAYAFSRFRRAY